MLLILFSQFLLAMHTRVVLLSCKAILFLGLRFFLSCASFPGLFSLVTRSAVVVAGLLPPRPDGYLQHGAPARGYFSTLISEGGKKTKVGVVHGPHGPRHSHGATAPRPRPLFMYWSMYELVVCIVGGNTTSYY